MTRPAAPGETSSEFARDIYAEGQRRIVARSPERREPLRSKVDRRAHWRLGKSIDALVREVERLQAIVANQREEK